MHVSGNSSILFEDKVTGNVTKINNYINAFFHMGYIDENKYTGTLITDLSDNFCFIVLH